MDKCDLEPIVAHHHDALNGACNLASIRLSRFFCSIVPSDPQGFNAMLNDPAQTVLHPSHTGWFAVRSGTTCEVGMNRDGFALNRGRFRGFPLTRTIYP